MQILSNEKVKLFVFSISVYSRIFDSDKNPESVELHKLLCLMFIVIIINFYLVTLCYHGICYGPVSVSVCHKSVFY